MLSCKVCWPFLLMAYSIDSLEVADNPIVLFRGVVGSRAYGTQNANSDMDVRGIFVVPSAEYARLAQPPKQVADERNDRTYYSLVRFCELMFEANPTTIEMLFLPDDCIMKTSPAHSMLVDNRGLFVTQKAVDSHLGYALSQIKKARGTNKRVWNPWPEEPPQAEDYCLFLGDAKGRAVPVRETEVNLASCKVTRLVGNRAADMFALYDYGAPTGGIFHGGMLVETGAADPDPEAPAEDKYSACEDNDDDEGDEEAAVIDPAERSTLFDIDLYALAADDGADDDNDSADDAGADGASDSE